LEGNRNFENYYNNAWESQDEIFSLIKRCLGDTTDTDGDGIWDVVDTDDDNDGMPDDWELTYGLNPLVNDASVDSDGDGYSNLVEYYKRTNPVVNELASTTQEQRYYVLNPSVGGGALNVASLADSNSITSSSTTLTLNNYQQGTIPASDLGQGSVISGSGPFDVASNIDDTDILTPAQFAGKVFVIPHFRNSHTYYLLSPNGNANVSVSVGSTNANLLLTQGVVTTYNAGSDNTVSGVIISDVPILVAHTSGVNDAYIVPPATTKLVGVLSNLVFVGALENNTTVTVTASNGASQIYTLNKGGRITPAIGVSGAQGQGNTYHIEADKPIGAAQGGDGDGNEQSAFWPPEYFATRFAMPVNVQYIVVSCLQANVTVTLTDPINGTVVNTCNSDGTIPGRAYFGSATNGVNINAGAKLESTAPIYVMVENTAKDDEQNLLGNLSEITQTMASINQESQTRIAQTTSPLTLPRDAAPYLVPVSTESNNGDNLRATGLLIKVANNLSSQQLSAVTEKPSANAKNAQEKATQPQPTESQLVVVAANPSAKSANRYKVFRKGPETQNKWVQTAEDPNAYDRPATVYYVTADTVEMWKQAKNSDAAVRTRVPFDAREFIAKVNKTQGSEVDGFIKVDHGTPIDPVAINSEVWTYSYDANGNVSSIVSSSGERIYGYDNLNRVTQDTNGATQTIAYDRNGNRTSDTIDPVTNTYNYVLNSNKLDTDPAGTVGHDAAGNRTSDQGGNRTFEYNNAGRLWKVYEGGQLKATYTYNAMGQRTRKVTAQGTTVYHYDLSGNLIEETTDTGTAQRDYVYMGSTPVAQIDINAGVDTLTYLHTDHLGTPRRATSETGAVVWSWDSDAFGKTVPNQDPDNDGVSTIINLRFAGQYYDAETGLHYNYYRYYDPSIGRYVSSDLIGLLGGLNTFAYVNGNPLIYIDPDGNQSTKKKAAEILLWIIATIGGGHGDITKIHPPRIRPPIEEQQRIKKQVTDNRKKKKGCDDDYENNGFVFPDALTIQDAICQETGEGCLPGQYEMKEKDWQQCTALGLCT